MKKITICASMSFFPKVEEVKSLLESKGFITYTPDAKEFEIDYSILTDEEKRNIKKDFIDKHIAYIKESDAVLVVNEYKNNTKGYIGANTFLEIAIAYVLNKKIYILNALGEQDIKEEVEAIQPIILNGDIDGITK